MKRVSRNQRRLSLENRLTWLAFGAAAPAAVIALIILWSGDYSAKVQWTLTIFIFGCFLGFISSAREHLIRPLQTMTNLLAALREGDYSIRARGARENDALGEALLEVNLLGETLRVQHLGAFEATALLRTADGGPLGRLRRSAEELELAVCLDSNEDAPLTLNFPRASGRWGVRRSIFRERGLPHELLVLTDLSRTLREEERRAWQRLVRVLGHEMNNSLAPIKSIAASLETLLQRQPRPADWQDDARSGLKSIAARADALSRFMEAYARLARLPPPQKEDVDLGDLARRVVKLEPRMRVNLLPGPEARISADAAQIEQALINLLHNAVDASLETGGGVSMGWRPNEDCVEVFIDDEGPGIMNPTNLFVPFFTTKPEGSGIGLALCRQIAEAHGGSLSVSNRTDRGGAEALLRLPR